MAADAWPKAGAVVGGGGGVGGCGGGGSGGGDGSKQGAAFESAACPTVEQPARTTYHPTEASRDAESAFPLMTDGRTEPLGPRSNPLWGARRRARLSSRGDAKSTRTKKRDGGKKPGDAGVPLGHEHDANPGREIGHTTWSRLDVASSFSTNTRTTQEPKRTITHILCFSI